MAREGDEASDWFALWCEQELELVCQAVSRANRVLSEATIEKGDVAQADKVARAAVNMGRAIGQVKTLAEALMARKRRIAKDAEERMTDHRRDQWDDATDDELEAELRARYETLQRIVEAKRAAWAVEDGVDAGRAEAAAVAA